MALILSLRQGNDFYVGERQFVCSHVGQETDDAQGYYCKFTLSEGAKKWPIEIGEWADLGDGISISVGVRRRMKGRLASVMIRTDGSKVQRGDLYRKELDSSCTLCNGTKKIVVREICQQCHGFGCHACKGGSLNVVSTCPECA